MTCLKINAPASETLPSLLTLLTLPHPLKGQALLEHDHVIISKLAFLSRHLFGAYISAATEHAVIGPDAADIEYASWLPDPGALEVASWASNIRSAAR